MNVKKDLRPQHNHQILNSERINALRRLSNSARCYYLDYKLVSKESIDKLHSSFNFEVATGSQSFFISTCLRYEMYHFLNDAQKVENNKTFASISGALCIRRLLAILCGLQSEIISEFEIFMQTGVAIYDAAAQKKISKKLFWDLYEILQIAQDIRNKYDLNVKENYSTVGARFLDLKIEHPATVAIVGGGYMAESFLRNINQNKVKRIIWINRSVDKVKRLIKSFNLKSTISVFFQTFESAPSALQKADFVFVAARGCGGIFKGMVLSKAKCVVDVSYPALFSFECCKEFYTISNTYFERWVENPVPKETVLEVETVLDDIIRQI